MFLCVKARKFHVSNSCGGNTHVEPKGFHVIGTLWFMCLKTIQADFGNSCADVKTIYADAQFHTGKNLDFLNATSRESQFENKNSFLKIKTIVIKID